MSTREIYLKETKFHKGVVFGLRQAEGHIKQLGKVFPDRGTEVTASNAEKLVKRYPQKYGYWDKLTEEQQKHLKVVTKAKRQGIIVPARPVSVVDQPTVGRRKSHAESMPKDDVVPEDELNDFDLAPSEFDGFEGEPEQPEKHKPAARKPAAKKKTTRKRAPSKRKPAAKKTEPADSNMPDDEPAPGEKE